jgi:mannitol/fructose-specific phosphotransferase system IIA component (Ntr-type)
MHFAELFSEETVICGLEASDRDGCVREMLQALVAAKRLDRKESERALDAIVAREKIGTTGVGGGVAIPHVKIAGLGRIAAALGIHRGGVEFQSIDGAPVRILFLIVRPDGDDAGHLQFLQWVSRLARNADFRRFVVNAGSTGEILALLHEMSGI